MRLGGGGKRSMRRGERWFEVYVLVIHGGLFVCT